MEKIIRKFIKEQIKALHESKKHVVKYSKSNNTYQVWLGDEIVTDFTTKERANAKAKNLNDLQNAKDVDKAQLKEAEVKGDVVNLHYRFDVSASPSDGDMSSVIDYVENNEVVSKYGIKVEVGKLEAGSQENESSVYVKFSFDRSKRGGTMTAIRLLREIVIEFIEKKIGAVAVDIEAKDFKPDGPSDDEYDQMAQQSSMDDRRQQGMDPGLEEAARGLGYLDEIGNFHDPRMSSGNFDHLTPEKEKQSLFLLYREGSGKFYKATFNGQNIGIDDVNRLLRSKDINMMIPSLYDDKILDQISDALKNHDISMDHIDNKDVSEAYTSEWDPETAAKNLRVAKGIEPKYTTYTKGEKVTYLGYPAVITGVKEYNDKIYYSVSYDKGNGKTKASSILSTDGTIKSLEEAKSKEDQLKIARAAYDKAEMDGDIRGQELALAAIDLIKGKRIKGLSKPSRLKEISAKLGYLNKKQ